MQVEFEGGTFSIKKILSSFFKYKFTNLFIIFFVVLLGLFYYYTKHPVYETYATLKIKANPLERREDFFGHNIGMYHGIETEIDILKSEFLINKTLRAINMEVSYYQKDGFKTKILYQDKPFEIVNLDVSNKKLFGKKFIIKNLDRDTFKLYLKHSLKSKILSYLHIKKLQNLSDKVYRYGDRVYLNGCSFIVHKIKPFKNYEYSFNFNRYRTILESIKQNLSIKPASFKSSVLRITYKDSDSKRARDFLNSYLENYLNYSKHNMVETDNKTLYFIQKQLSYIKNKLENSENLLKDYKQKNNISDVQTQKRTVINRLGKFQDDLKNSEVELDILKSIYSHVNHDNYNSVSSLARAYPVLNTMLQNLQNLQIQREKMLATLTKAHPDVVTITYNINSVKRSIKEASKAILERAQKRRNSLKKVVYNYIDKLKKFPKIEQELIKHKRVFTVNDTVYNYLLKKESELSIEKAASILDKEILDYAKESLKPISPKLSLILPTSLFLGLLFSLLHTILRLKLDTKIKDRYDIYERTDIPLFGQIPFVTDKKLYNQVYVLNDPTSWLSEAYRSVKNNLEYIVTDKKSKVILVTSTIPNEGKTTVCANLASILGMGEKKAIILSLDLRKPELHHKFGLSNKMGMSDVLSNRVNIDDVTWQHQQYKNFFIVTSGSIPPNPAELIGSKNMSNLIDELRGKYDYIILDTPPIDYVNDAYSLMKLSDIVLFVLKSEFSDKSYVDEIDKLSKSMKLSNIGIILNSIKSKYLINKKFDYKYIYHEV